MKRQVASVLAVAAMSGGLAVSGPAATAQAAVVTCSIEVGNILPGINNRYAEAKIRCNGATKVFWETDMFIKTGGEWRDGYYLGNSNMYEIKQWGTLNSVNWQKLRVTGQEDKCEYIVTSTVSYNVPGSSVRRKKEDTASANFCN